VVLPAYAHHMLLQLGPQQQTCSSGLLLWVHAEIDRQMAYTDTS